MIKALCKYDIYWLSKQADIEYTIMKPLLRNINTIHTACSNNFYLVISFCSYYELHYTMVENGGSL